MVWEDAIRWVKKTGTGDPPECAIFGLGNPGREYAGTRHNVGFDALDILAERHSLRINRNQDHALVAVGSIKGHKVLLAKPLTYMNLSGGSIKALLRRYELSPADMLVIADDLALDVGRIRLKPKGSAGGHNGHKSIISSLGTTEYPRLKIGIGGPRGDQKDYVLSRPSGAEKAEIDDSLKRSVEAIETFIIEGLNAAMNRANSDETGAGD